MLQSLYVMAHLFLYTLLYREGLMLQSPSKSKYHIHTLLSALLSAGLLWYSLKKAHT